MEKRENYLLLQEYALKLHKDTGVTFRYMAKQLDYCEVMFYKLRAGKRVPSLAQRKVIEKWSKGLIKASRLM
jgi:hypothetical protein